MPQDFGCPYQDDRCRRSRPTCQPCQHGHGRYDDHRDSRRDNCRDSRHDDHRNRQHSDHRDDRHDRPGYGSQRRW